MALSEIPLDNIKVSDKEYRLKKLLTKPNAQNRWSEFMYSLSAFYDIAGWALIYGAKVNYGSDKGLYSELYSLPTHLLEILGSSPLNPVDGYILDGDFRKKFDAKDCVPIRSFSPRFDKQGGHLYGVSKVRAGWSELQTYIASKERQYTGLVTGDSAHILFPKNPDAQLTEVTSPELKTFKDTILGALRTKDMHSTAIVGQELGAINLASTLSTSQAIESQQDIRDMMASLWSLPPRIVFNDARSATYNNMVEDKKNALYNGVFPFLNNVDDAINEDIVMPLYGLKMAFDYDVYPELLPNISDDMVKLDKVSFLTDDEKREFFQYGELPNEMGKIPTKFQHIAIQGGGGMLTPGMSQGNGTFNRGNPAQQAAGYEQRSSNQRDQREND